MYLDIRKALNKNGEVSANMKKNLGEFKSDMEYVSIAYYRSQIMFDELYKFMGSKKFEKFLKSLIKNYKYQSVNTDGLLGVAKSVKRGSENLLKNYINGKTNVS